MATKLERIVNYVNTLYGATSLKEFCHRVECDQLFAKAVSKKYDASEWYLIKACRFALRGDEYYVRKFKTLGIA